MTKNNYWAGKKHSPATIKKMSERALLDGRGLSRKGEKQSEIHKKRRADAQRGEKHWNWKGGISSENMKIRNSEENKLWTKNCMAHVDFTCQKCGLRNGRGETVSLQVHHILNFAQYPELRFAVSNGVVFCKKCHRIFHRLYGIKNNNGEQLEEYLTQE